MNRYVKIALLCGLNAWSVLAWSEQGTTPQQGTLKQEVKSKQGMANTGTATNPQGTIKTDNAPSQEALNTLFHRTFALLAGGQGTLETFTQKPMVINFMASWCVPCVREIPQLNQLAKRYPDIAFVGIGVDSPENLQAFQQKVTIDFPVYVGGFEAVQWIKTLGNPNAGLPFTLIFDQNGQFKGKILGQIDTEILKEALANLKH